MASSTLRWMGPVAARLAGPGPRTEPCEATCERASAWVYCRRPPLSARASSGSDASDRAGGAGGMDLWIARRDGIRWVDPRPLPFNTPGTETEPAFSPDGRWLYFASERKGGRGGLDLYRVAFDGQRWGAPEPLVAL